MEVLTWPEASPSLPHRLLPQRLWPGLQRQDTAWRGPETLEHAGTEAATGQWCVPQHPMIQSQMRPQGLGPGLGQRWSWVGCHAQRICPQAHTGASRVNPPPARAAQALPRVLGTVCAELPTEGLQCLLDGRAPAGPTTPLRGGMGPGPWTAQPCPGLCSLERPQGAFPATPFLSAPGIPAAQPQPPYPGASQPPGNVPRTPSRVRPGARVFPSI